MAIYYKELDQHIVVSGKTYPYRDQIKQLGGRFQAQSKVWLIPNSQQGLDEIRQLCKRVGGGLIKSPSNPAPQAVTTLDALHAPASQSSPPLSSAMAPAQDVSTGWSISELLNRVQLSIAQAFPQPVWVIGEVHNLNHRKNGIYFQLADLKEGASRSATLTINATLWRDAKSYIESRQKVSDLLEILQEGMKIRVMAQVNLYRDRANLSLNILDIDPRYTKGALALQREELLRELRAKGLDRRNPSLSLARFPFRIGFISADKSRAKTDFLDQLQLFRCPVQILFVAAQMQGEATIKDVTSAIRLLNDAACDLIVLTRGGGSMADLRWFDNREIALSIAQSSVPILAAIGHHDDVCIAEEIAFRREKTPTAAADFIIAHFQQSDRLLEQFANALSQHLSQHLHRSEQAWLRLKQGLQALSQSRIERRHQELERLSYSLSQGFQNTQLTTNQRVQVLSGELQRACDSAIGKHEHQTQQLASRLLQAIQQHYHRIGQQTERLLFEWRRSIQTSLAGSTESMLRLENQIATSDPRPWLEKGWTQLFHRAKLVKHISDISTGDELEARLKDGKLTLKVSHKESKKEEDKL